MYDEQTATGVINASLAEPSSILVSKLNENGEQVEKLYALVEQLAGRLTSVRNSVPTNTAGEAVKESTFSPVVSQLVRQTDSIKSIQSYIANLLNELEV